MKISEKEQKVIAKLTRSVLKKEHAPIDEKTVGKLILHGITLDNIAALDASTVKILLEEFGVNMVELNSTFYKTVEERLSKPESLVYLERFIHYATTYGNMTELANHGKIYEPTQLSEEVFSLYATQQTIIKVVEEDIFKKIIRELLKSALALNSEEVAELVSAAVKLEVEIPAAEEIKNKEIYCQLIKLKLLVPNSAQEFVKAMGVILTDSTLFVKNARFYCEVEETIEEDFLGIESRYDSKIYKLYSLLESFKSSNDLRLLAEGYRKDKKFYLVIRKALQKARKTLQEEEASDEILFLENICTSLIKTINFISRYNKKVNISTINKSFFYMNSEEEQEFLKLASTPTLLKVLNRIKEYKSRYELGNDVSTDYYRIRNGKVHIKEFKITETSQVRKLNLDELSLKEFTLVEQLKKRLSSRYIGKKVKLNTLIQYRVPSSMKSFLGNVPEFTSVHVDEEVSIGISWSEDVDLDLHAISSSGKRVSYFEEGIENIVFSGDMTSGNKYGYAAEYMTFNPVELSAEIILFSMSGYWVDSKSELKYVIARKNDKTDARYIINPDKIIYSANESLADSISRSFCLYYDNEFYFMNLTQRGKIPSDDLAQKIMPPLLIRAKSSLTLEEFFTLMGATIVFDGEDYDLDFSTPSPSELIDLLNHK